MSNTWDHTTFTSTQDALDKLTELQGKSWLCRGQPRPYECGLAPSIDRDQLKNLSRAEKLQRERQSIDIFRSAARFFASSGEANAANDDVIALMVLRHYSTPTRLLDWTTSPFVAAYFAVCSESDQNGELWSFSHEDYAREGKAQWRTWPETTTDRSGNDDKFQAGLTAFLVDEPPDWIIACFYPKGFPRQEAQHGCYTMTARFGINHADKLAELMRDKNRYHRYVIPGKLKGELHEALRSKHGLWRGSLFPDSAGAAEIAKTAF